MHALPSDHWVFASDPMHRSALITIRDTIQIDGTELIERIDGPYERSCFENLGTHNIFTLLDGLEMEHEAMGNICLIFVFYRRRMGDTLKKPFEYPIRKFQCTLNPDVERQVMERLSLNEFIASTTFAYAHRNAGLKNWMRKAQQKADVPLQSRIQERLDLLPKYYNHHLERITGLGKQS